MALTTSAPLIVGAGPTGLAAALFLAERGVRSRIIDSSLEPSRTSRAQAVNPRTLELLESTGVASAIIKEGRTLSGVRFYEDWNPIAKLDFGNLPSSYAMTVISQARTEALLTNALKSHGLAAERGIALQGLQQDGHAVHALLARRDGNEKVEVPILLAADGAHSRAREALGIAFEGRGFPELWPLYDIHFDDPLDVDHAHVFVHARWSHFPDSDTARTVAAVRKRSELAVATATGGEIGGNRLAVVISRRRQACRPSDAGSCGVGGRCSAHSFANWRVA